MINHKIKTLSIKIEKQSADWKIVCTCGWASGGGLGGVGNNKLKKEDIRKQLLKWFKEHQIAAAKPKKT